VPVALSDLAATIVALARAEPLPKSKARSLVDLIGKPESASARPIYLYADDTTGAVHIGARAVIEGRFKYVRDVTTNVDQLFDLDADPGESENLRRSNPDVRAHLARQLDGWLAFTTMP
ncbi:MAG: Choline-sulfatase, partial [Myxococcaceae bacterium]|nr:Choline-sulfatase [Myxococcaceae bacterium]